MKGLSGFVFKLGFVLSALAFTTTGLAQTDLWWTGLGSTPNWNEAANWSTTDPAGIITTAISPPSAAINVYFTDASFPGSDPVDIRIDNAANCRNLNFSGIGNAYSVNFNGAGTLSIYGSLFTLPNNLLNLYNYTGDIEFKSTTIGTTIDFNNQSLRNNIAFDGIGGEWTLLNGITIESSKKITLRNGTLRTNNQNLACGAFNVISGVSPRKVFFGNSTITVSQQGTSFLITNSTTLSGTPTVYFTSPWPVGLSHGLTSPSAGFSYKKIEALSSIALTFGADNVATIDSLICPGFNISSSGGSFTAKSIVVQAQNASSLNNKTVTCDTLIINGGGCSKFFNISDGILNFTKRPSFFQDAFLKNVTAQITNAPPVTPISVINGVDGGNNWGWSFTNTTRNLYWIGNSGTWHDPVNWSLTSGGAPLSPADCPPTIYDNVFFDAGSFNADDQAVSIEDLDAYCKNMIWQGLDQENIDWIGSAGLYLAGDLKLDPNMKPVISYDQEIRLLDAVDGVLDFGSGAANRSMTNTPFYWAAPGAKYRQACSRVSIESLKMEGDVSRSYNLGGHGDTLEVASVNYAGTIDMTDAIVLLSGSGTNVYGKINLQFNDHSHWYVTAPGTFSYSSVNNTFPSTTIVNPAATANFSSGATTKSPFSVVGTFTSNASVTFDSHTITEKLVLAAGKNYYFASGATLSVGDSLLVAGTSCGTGAKLLPLVSGGSYNIAAPNQKVKANFATITNAVYAGGAGQLDLVGQNAVDGGANVNIDFGSNSGKVYYWRKSSLDGTYTGNWADPLHWTLNKTDVVGQFDASGCVPSALDSVVFDALSGNGSFITVSLSGNQSVKSLVFVNAGADALPNNFTFFQNGVLEIKQYLSFSDNLNHTGNGTYNFNGTGTTYIDTKNRYIAGSIALLFSGGTKLLLSPINAPKANVELISGEFNTNRYTVTIGTFLSNSNNPRTLKIANGIINLYATRTISGTPFSWNISNPGTITVNASGSTINNLATTNYSFYGGSQTYGGVLFKPSNNFYSYTFTIRDNNTYADSLYVQGTAIFTTPFTVNKLNLAANYNHQFPAGGVTTFMPTGNLEKNGDLNQYLILRSSVTGSYHSFIKSSGSKVFVCNIAVSYIRALGVAFQTNDASTFNGIAGSANPTFPIGSTWNFKAAIGKAQISMTNPADIHMNVGDSVYVNYQITLNNVGPYKVLFEDGNGDHLENVPSSGNSSTSGAFYISPAATESILIADFKYFDCPGYYPDGTILNNQTNVNVPPISNGIVVSEAHEIYTMKNLNSYVYMMNGEDRADLGSYSIRTVQVAINDKTSATDIDALGTVSVRTKIDATERKNGATHFLMRHYDFEAASANKDAMVKFFFTQAELQSLKAQDPKASATETELEYLQRLIVFKLPLGGDPASGYYPTIPKLSSGIASEIAGDTYYIEAIVPDFIGSYYIGTLALPLPVTLLSFNAVSENNRVNITWMANNEVGVQGYTVMRSVDGKRWEAIATVSARNNGSVNERYQVYDNHPLPNFSYYKLEINDKGNSRRYSSIVRVWISKGGVISISPNPAKNTIVISFDRHAVNRTIQLTNIVGAKLNVPIQFNAYNAVMNLTGLPSAVYILLVADEDGEEKFKIIKE